MNAVPSSDPHLIDAVSRSRRSLRFWGVLFAAEALVSALTLGRTHPLIWAAPLATAVIVAAGLQPSSFALAATYLVSGALRALPVVAQTLGPDPLLAWTDVAPVHLIAIAFTRLVLAQTAVQQFLHYRLLYGTARATGPVAELPALPPMVANRTELTARWSLWCGISSLLAVGSALTFASPVAAVAALDLAGGLATLAIGLGLGATFSPTDHRSAALTGAVAGMVGYGAALQVGLSLLAGR